MFRHLAIYQWTKDMQYLWCNIVHIWCRWLHSFEWAPFYGSNLNRLAFWKCFKTRVRDSDEEKVFHTAILSSTGADGRTFSGGGTEAWSGMADVPGKSLNEEGDVGGCIGTTISFPVQANKNTNIIWEHNTIRTCSSCQILKLKSNN